MIISILFLIIRVIEVLVLIRIILSWIAPSKNEFTQLVYNLTEPLLAPFRINIPLGHVYMDIAPLVLYFVLWLVKNGIIMLARFLI